MGFVRFLGRPDTSLERDGLLGPPDVYSSPLSLCTAARVRAVGDGRSDFQHRDAALARGERGTRPPPGEGVPDSCQWEDPGPHAPAGLDTKAEKLESSALQRDVIREILEHRKISKVIVVPQRLVSIVLEDAVEDGAVPEGASTDRAAEDATSDGPRRVIDANPTAKLPPRAELIGLGTPRTLRFQ